MYIQISSTCAPRPLAHLHVRRAHRGKIGVTRRLGEAGSEKSASDLLCLPGYRSRRRTDQTVLHLRSTNVKPGTQNPQGNPREPTGTRASCQSARRR